MSNFENKFRGRSVTLKDHENISQLLRRFKKKIDDSNTLEDLKKKEAYDKPSVHRKKAKASAKARWRKRVREDQLPPKLY
jgi:small subunit ribosomal protein S21